MEIDAVTGKRTGDWAYGYYEYDSYGSCHFISVIETKPELNQHNVLVDGETVGQLWIPSFGIRVYGGDLVKAICTPSGSKSKKERLCLIKETNIGFGISVWHFDEWYSYSSMDFTSIKVIGNIYSNPELLK